jgi:hypothetical protein
MIRLKPDISSIFEANASPVHMRVAAMRTMNTRDRMNPAGPVILMPNSIPEASMITACTMAVVTPPAVLPRTLAILLTGATMFSFRKVH